MSGIFIFYAIGNNTRSKETNLMQQFRHFTTQLIQIYSQIEKLFIIREFVFNMRDYCLCKYTYICFI